MKKYLLLFFISLSATAYSQKGFKINLISSLDHSELEVKPSEDFYNIDKAPKNNFGYTIDLSIEVKSGVNSAILFGIKKSKKNYYPNQGVIFYYGGRLSYNEETLLVSAPYLDRLEFETISIPILHKQYFKSNGRFSFYSLAGGTAEFNLQRKETYLDYRYLEDGVFDIQQITASKRAFRLFSTSIEVGGGLSAKLSQRLSILMQSNFRLLEFRRSNERLMTIWPDGGFSGDFHWKDKFMFFGQISFGLGLQVDLCHNS